MSKLKKIIYGTLAVGALATGAYFMQPEPVKQEVKQEKIDYSKVDFSEEEILLHAVIKRNQYENKRDEMLIYLEENKAFEINKTEKELNSPEYERQMSEIEKKVDDFQNNYTNGLNILTDDECELYNIMDPETKKNFLIGKREYLPEEYSNLDEGLQLMTEAAVYGKNAGEDEIEGILRDIAKNGMSFDYLQEQYGIKAMGYAILFSNTLDAFQLLKEFPNQILEEDGKIYGEEAVDEMSEW